MLQNNTISSTVIREALLKGNINTANEYLGYPYFFSGTVIEGNKLGRTIGYPTANLKCIDEEKKCRSALQEYIKVVEKFGAGAFADDAYMRIGMCSIDVGNLEDAKIFFTEIVKNYKKSPLVKQAQVKLDDVSARLEKEAKDRSTKDKDSKKKGK